MKENRKEWLKAITNGIVAAVIVIQFIMPTMVEGISMEPNFEGGDYLLVSKQAYTNGKRPKEAMWSYSFLIKRTRMESIRN